MKEGHSVGKGYDVSGRYDLEAAWARGWYWETSEELEWADVLATWPPAWARGWGMVGRSAPPPKRRPCQAAAVRAASPPPPLPPVDPQPHAPAERARRTLSGKRSKWRIGPHLVRVPHLTSIPYLLRIPHLTLAHAPSPRPRASWYRPYPPGTCATRPHDPPPSAPCLAGGS